MQYAVMFKLNGSGDTLNALTFALTIVPALTFSAAVVWPLLALTYNCAIKRPLINYILLITFLGMVALLYWYCNIKKIEYPVIASASVALATFALNILIAVTSKKDYEGSSTL
jgi:hypothetical protein